MKFPFMAGKQYYIYSKESLEELLETIGLSSEIVVDSVGIKDKIYEVETTATYYQNQFYFENERFNSMTCEIQDVIEDMRANKGGTKKALADRLEKILNYYS